jgi:hypothetical protein
MLSVVLASLFALVVLTLLLLGARRALGKRGPKLLGAPDRATVRDCFNPSRDRRVR